MRNKNFHLGHAALLIILTLNVLTLMINFNSVLSGDTEGFTADLLRGLGVPVQNEDNQESPVPRLTTEVLANYDEKTEANSIPITSSKIINSFSLPSWGGLGFGFRKNITIDSTKVPSDLTDFPLLIDLKEAYEIFGVTQSSGNDIIFTDSLGTILDHEIELFDIETSHFVAWVRVPNLSSSSNTLLSMYYGNETIGTLQNPSGVWDNDYMAVYHLNDDPSSTIYDSTSNNNDGSSYGTVLQEEGPMGNAYFFDQQGGTNDYLRIPQSSSISLTGNQMTLEGWVYLQFTPVPYDSMIFDKAGDYYGTQGWMMGVDGADGGFINAVGYPSRLNQRINTVDSQGIRADNGQIYPGKWTYLSVLYDGSSFTGYIDGTNVYSGQSLTGDIINVDMDLYIAKRDEVASRMFYGSMDELRISDVARSTGYITTCFNNYNDPESFHSISFQEPSISSYEEQRTLTIDSSIVSGSTDLTNFPLLLDLYLENASQNIIFKDSSNQILEHEIEFFGVYNSSHDHLAVWLKIPTLSSSSDTEIIMYTDSTLAIVQSNPDIWTDYTAVWHLGESVVDETSSNNAHVDSTSQNNDGDQHGNDENQSIIGYAQEFDGINDYIDMGDPDALELVGDSYFTFTGWFYRDSTSTDDYIIDKWDAIHGGSDGTGYFLWIDQSDGKLKFQSNDDDDDGFILESASNFNTLPIGWYHYAITFHTSPGTLNTADLMQMYINGVKENTIASLWGIGAPAWNSYDDFNPFTNTKSFTLSNTANPFDGFLDEIRITEQILTEDWIRTEVRNQLNKSAYLTVGPETESLKLWHDDSFRRRKDLKIDSSNFVGASNEKHIILRPGARGLFYNEWGVAGATYRHEAVDEVIADDWTTYITHSSNNSYRREMFYAVGLPSTIPSGTITNIRVYSTARTSGDVSSYDFQHYVTIGGNNQWFGGRSLSGSWVTAYTESTTNPVNSQPWTWQDLEDFEFGVDGQIVEGVSAGYLRVTRVYAMVTYIPEPSPPLKNFPIYIDLFDTDLKTDVQVDGDDIRFYDEYGRKLAHEIIEFEQNYNSSHAYLSTWIEIPTLSTGGDSYISMYYGNSTLGNQEQVTDTWEEFLAVYHLEESPTGSILDSTANNLDLSSSGTMTSGDLVDGQLGSSIDFDGTNDQLYTTQTVSIGSFTVSAWINFDSGANWRSIVNLDRAVSNWRQFSVYNWNPQFDGASYSYAFGGPLSTFNWYYIVFTYDANTTEFEVYINGVQSGPTRYLSIPNLTDDFQLGAWGTSDWWDGKLDEVRITTQTRSLAWIKAEYANQFNPDTFISIGQEIELIPPVINSFGVDDPGNGNPTFWANVTDHDSSIASVSFRVNTTDVMMTKNASGVWTYQLPTVMYGDYYTYQITNASDSNENYLKSASTIQNITFDYDTVLPTVIDWDYNPYAGVNGKFNANVSDSWGNVNTVMVNVTAHDNPNVVDLSGLWAMMKYTASGYVNDTLKMLSGTISFVITVTDTFGNSFTSTEHVSIVINHAPSVENVLLSRSLSNATLLPVYSNSTAMYLHYDYIDVDDSGSESGTQIRWYKWNGTAWVQQGAYDNTKQVPRTALIKGAIWRVSVRPKDGVDFGNTVYSGNITIQNTAPLIQTPTMTPSNPKTGNDLTVSYTWIDADSMDTDQSLIQWYRDNGTGYYLIDAYTNNPLLPSSVTLKGDKWRVNVTASDGLAFGNSLLSLELIIANTAPTLEVDINNKKIPSTVANDTDLLANYTYFDADNDLINLTSLEYQWLKFNTSSNKFEIFVIGINTISNTSTSIGDLWRVEIRVNDGTDSSGWIISATISIGIAPNNPPSAIEVNLTLSNAVVGGFLYISYTFTDPDVGDNESISLYRWYRNGVYQPQFDGIRNLTSATLIKGDSWYAEVRPRDDFDYGDWTQSSAIIIGNTAPQVTSIEIFPETAFTTNVLVANYGNGDSDGDSIVQFKIIWMINSVPIPALENETEVPSSYTSKGEFWTFEVFVYDGTDWSISKTSLPKKIENSEPTITDITLTGGGNSSTNITLSYTFDDLDGDLETGTTISWWIFNGVSFNEISNDKLELISSSFVAGNLVYAEITPDDGDSIYTGSSVSTIGLPNGLIIVGNSAPGLYSSPNIIGQNDSISFTAGFPLYVNYSAFDPDSGEAAAIYDIELDIDGYVVGAKYEWYRNDIIVTSITGPVVSIDYLVKDDSWFVRVKPRDRYGAFGAWINSSKILIANSNPEVTGIWFMTTFVTTSSDIYVEFTYSDIDDDPIKSDNTSILWYKNGFLITGAENRTIVSNQLIGDVYYVIIALNSIYYQKDDNISVIVNPFDGTDWAVENATSTAIQIQNTIPTVFNLKLLPHNQNGTIIFTTDRINLTWIYSDIDGDNESTPIIIWEKDDITQPLYVNSLFIPASATNKGEKWDAIVRVYDGTNYSIEVSITVFIANSIPTLTEVVLWNNYDLSNTSYSDGSISIFDYEFTDADFDPLNTSLSSIKWFRNGNYTSKYDNQTSISSSELLKGDYWYALVQILDLDGVVWSNNRTSQIIYIINKAPEVTSLTIPEEENYLVENENITLVLTIFDPDFNDTDVSLIEWLVNGTLQPQYTNQRVISYIDTNPGDNWTLVITPSDGFDNGALFTRSIIIESIPHIQNLSIIIEQDIDGHFTFGLQVLDARHDITSVEYKVYLNGTDLDIVDTLNFPNATEYWILDYILSNSDYYNTEALINIKATSSINIESTRSFTFTIIDGAAPRVSKTGSGVWFVKNSDDPTHLSFFADIEEYGSGVANVTLYYYYSLSEAGEGSTVIQDFSSVLMIFNTSADNTLIYAVTIPFPQDKNDYEILYWVATQDMAGNSNPVAFDIRHYPDRINNEKISQITTGGLPEWVLLVAGLVILLIFVGSVVYVRFIRKPEIVGLDKELVMKGVPDINEEEIIAGVDRHTLGLVVSFFDQLHGPIPIIVIPEILKDNYSKLVELSDHSFSGTRFSDDYTSEVDSSYSFILAEQLRIKVLSYGFALEKPEARGGQENLTLNILVHNDIFNLVEQFKDKIQQKVHEFHMTMAEDSSNKVLIRIKANEVRKYVSAIVLSYINVYGTTDLIEEDEN